MVSKRADAPYRLSGLFTRVEIGHITLRSAAGLDSNLCCCALWRTGLAFMGSSGMLTTTSAGRLRPAPVGRECPDHRGSRGCLWKTNQAWSWPGAGGAPRTPKRHARRLAAIRCLVAAGARDGSRCGSDAPAGGADPDRAFPESELELWWFGGTPDDCSRSICKFKDNPESTS
jgi:hypothetical protein